MQRDTERNAWRSTTGASRNLRSGEGLAPQVEAFLWRQLPKSISLINDQQVLEAGISALSAPVALLICAFDYTP